MMSENQHKQKKEIPQLFSDKSECCGCSACYSICTSCAISMVSDEKGFLYPQINSGYCIRCYQCIYVCNFKITRY